MASQAKARRAKKRTEISDTYSESMREIEEAIVVKFDILFKKMHVSYHLQSWAPSHSSQAK